MMKNTFLIVYVKFQDLLNGDEGQDLIEYALLITLITLATITSVQGIATSIVNVFTNISTSLV